MVRSTFVGSKLWGLNDAQGVGAGLTVLRKGAIGLSALTRRRLLVSLEIPSNDRAYPWFLEWMSVRSKLQQQSRGLNLRSHQLSVETSVKQHDNGSSEVQFSLVPGPGTHYFRYRGAWMQVRTNFTFLKLIMLNFAS